MKQTTASTIFFSLLSTTYAQEPSRFTLVTASSNPDLHLKSINASNFQWWINKPTASYCPDVASPNCPVGNVTSVVGGQGGLSMNVEVPGGQLVYVNPAGQIKYTQAHSGSMDPNSTTSGWQYTPSVARGYGQLTWTTETGHGFIACPDGEGAFTIMTVSGDALPAQCEQVDLLVPELTETGDTGVEEATAWQYT